MMTTILRIICLNVLIMILPFFALAASQEETILMTLPEAMLAKTINQAVPLHISPDSKTFNGSIFINSIKNLQIDDGAVSALLDIVGKDILVTTEVAGHQLRLKLGTVQLDFNVTANIRYDQPAQTLYIKPVVSDINTSGDTQGTEVATLLVSLFNGKEFPIAIQKLQPIITDTGSKQVAINLQISDILLVKNAVTLYLLPAVQTIVPAKKN